MKGLDGYPHIIEVKKLEHERVNFGGVWHTDTAYLERPPMATLLLAREVPRMAAIPCLRARRRPMKRCPRACAGCSTGCAA